MREDSWSRGRTRAAGIIPVNGINRAVIQAVNFGRTLSRDVRAVFVTEDPEHGEEIRDRWERQVPGVPLAIVESPYRAVISPVLAYLDVLDQAWPPDKAAPITIGPARVRGPALVGAALLQPDLETAQAGHPGPRAHGHRGRPVPPRVSDSAGLAAPAGSVAVSWPSMPDTDTAQFHGRCSPSTAAPVMRGSSGWWPVWPPRPRPS